MNQRNKYALLGIVLLAALTAACTSWADAEATAAAGDEAPAGPAVGEKEQLEPAAQPDNSGDGKAVEASADKPPQPAAQAAPSDVTAGDDAPEPRGAGDGTAVGAAEEEPAAAESVLEARPSPAADDQQAGTPPAAVTDTVEKDAESRQPSREETTRTKEGDAAPPAEKTDQSGTAGEPVLTVIEPDFVRALTGVAAGRNDSNPVWSPSGSMIAFERSIGDNREIIVARSDGSIIQKIQCRPAKDDSEMEFFMPGIVEETSYNAGISWSPDEGRLVFMSNGGSGNYDLYLLPTLGEEKTIRLTENTEKDSHPHWSPIGERLAFVSGRTGKAEIYMMDLVSRRVSILTSGAKTYLYPQWSPDGRRLALMYGSNENHDIYVIEDLRQPSRSLTALTTWEFDDLRPAWSPDGSKIAFYSNYNPVSDPKVWAIIVVAADGSDPSAGEGLAARVVARNVVPDVERGPAWMPDSRRIVFVKSDSKSYNPIYIANIDNPSEIPLRTETKMNHDVVCSKTGMLAFRSQTDQWDQIYVVRLKEEVARREPQ